ncbi:hypothetical protein QF046_001457 [Microbacterium sp. W4I4]|uniref:hypothetical protein n=1 Tax=Microbacterium sp. W4I4 TaxID=3042295 RepID=UPI002780639C|nr:hypothetical protein [Microbacterium sp. W4I4]MDQ0613816.1 hypothetical protein [Microbacterium sp. W4I4]
MPKKPSPLPTTLGGHFSTTIALQSGVNRRRLRSKDLTAPFHGTRRTQEDINAENEEIEKDASPLALSRAVARRIRSKALSFLHVMPEGGFVCGKSAAALREYPITPGDDLDIGTITPHRSPRGRGIKGRRIEAHLVEVELLDGIPVTTPASTWAMLAKDPSVRELTQVADAILHIPRDNHGRPHPELAGGTREDLQAMIDAGRRIGVNRLREALACARVGSASPLETDYRLDAEADGLPEPELDVEIRDARGRLIGISEIVYPAYKTVVEVEGDHHRTSRRQWNRDIQKYRDYAEAGWEVVRLTSQQIRVDRTATRIVRAVLNRRRAA